MEIVITADFPPVVSATQQHGPTIVFWKRQGCLPDAFTLRQSAARGVWLIMFAEEAVKARFDAGRSQKRVTRDLKYAG